MFVLTHEHDDCKWWKNIITAGDLLFNGNI